MQKRFPVAILGISLVLLIVVFGGIRKSAMFGVPNETVPTSTAPQSDTYLAPNLRNVSIKANDSISSPLTITGEARTWYFEASFPVELLDGAGRRLAIVPAGAQGNWMTTEFVPFKATLQFAPPATAEGTLILRNDNPSDMREKDEIVRLPVRFAEADKSACRKTGCSGQICSDKDTVSTCEFRADYACYQAATCERQTNGQCGWTMTAELEACLKDPPPLQ